MIAKIIPHKSVAKCLTYVMEKEGAELLFSNHVRDYDKGAMIEDFKFYQSLLDNRVNNDTYHIAISFHKNDKLTSDIFKAIASKVILGMNWQSCPNAAFRHFDQKNGNPHCHLIVGRCGIDGKATENRFSYQRMNIIRMELEKQYPFLKAAKGKNLSDIDETRLRGKDAIKHFIYKAIHKEIPSVKTVQELLDILKDKYQIISRVITDEKSNKNTGLVYSVIGKPEWIKASQIDKSVTFQQLEKAIEKNGTKQPMDKGLKDKATFDFQQYLSDRKKEIEELGSKKSKEAISISLTLNGNALDSKNIEIHNSINLERIEKDKHYIKEAIKAEIYQVQNVQELLSRLKIKYEIDAKIKYKGESDVVQGINFGITGTDNWIKGSGLKKEFSYSNLQKIIEQNVREGKIDKKTVITNLMNQKPITPLYKKTEVDKPLNLSINEREYLKNYIIDTVKHVQAETNSNKDLIKVLESQYEIFIETEANPKEEESRLIFSTGDMGVYFSEEELETELDVIAVQTAIEENEIEGKSSKPASKSKKYYFTDIGGQKSKKSSKSVFIDHYPPPKNFGQMDQNLFKAKKQKRR